MNDSKIRVEPMTKVLNIVALASKGPRETRHMHPTLRISRLVAIMKPGGGVRSLVLYSAIFRTLDRIVAGAIIDHAPAALRAAHHLQHGLDASGTLCVAMRAYAGIRVARMARTHPQPGWEPSSILLTDAQNAFCTAHIGVVAL